MLDYFDHVSPRVRYISPQISRPLLPQGISLKLWRISHSISSVPGLHSQLKSTAPHPHCKQCLLLWCVLYFTRISFWCGQTKFNNRTPSWFRVGNHSFIHHRKWTYCPLTGQNIWPLKPTTASYPSPQATSEWDKVQRLSYVLVLAGLFVELVERRWMGTSEKKCEWVIIWKMLSYSYIWDGDYFHISCTINQ